jgi:hypothetical protein
MQLCDLQVEDPSDFPTLDAVKTFPGFLITYSRIVPLPAANEFAEFSDANG